MRLRVRPSAIAPILLAVALILPACSTDEQYKMMPGFGIPDHINMEPLKRSEYEILGDTTGRGCVKSWGFSLFPLPIFVDDTSYPHTYGVVAKREIRAWQSSGGAGVAKSIAYYNAIKAAPEGTDALLGERWDITDKGVNYFWYWDSEVCAAVWAKAVRIKHDGRE